MISGRGSRLCLALALDLALGEPPERWHPVCWMGKAIALAEKPFKGIVGYGVAKRSAGTAVAVALPLVTYTVTRRLLDFLPRPFGFALEVTALWTALAARSLFDSAAAVERGLSSGLEPAREQVAGMVGRDTGGLDEAGVARAAVESVAENANDGVVAPMFYAFIGGAPLALAYKMVNTLDSMVGYRDPRHRDFGWAPARLDDVAGYIPARLTGAAAVATSVAVAGNPFRAVKIWRRDAASHASPNAGVCESVFAGALGVRLGGSDSYGGVGRERSVIGAGLRQPQQGDIARAARLMLASVMATMTAGIFLLTAGSRIKQILSRERRR